MVIESETDLAQDVRSNAVRSSRCWYQARQHYLHNVVVGEERGPDLGRVCRDVTAIIDAISATKSPPSHLVLATKQVTCVRVGLGGKDLVRNSGFYLKRWE